MIVNGNNKNRVVVRGVEGGGPRRWENRAWQWDISRVDAELVIWFRDSVMHAETLGITATLFAVWGPLRTSSVSDIGCESGTFHSYCRLMQCDERMRASGPV